MLFRSNIYDQDQVMRTSIPLLHPPHRNIGTPLPLSSGTHRKISQHNSTNKISHTSIILQARVLQGSNTRARSQTSQRKQQYLSTDISKQVCLKKASTKWDTDRKKRRPPAWDPPKLLLVIVSGLHVEVGTSGVVGVLVDGGVGLRHVVVTTRKIGRASCRERV